MGEGFIWTEKTGLVNLNTYVKENLGYDDLGITFALPLGMSTNGKHIVGLGRTDDALVSFLITLPDSDLGTSEVINTKFEVFPNPTTDIIQIKTKGNLTSSVVYNLQGQIVLKSTKNEIDVSHLPNRIYILKTLIDGKEATKKIIKK